MTDTPIAFIDLQAQRARLGAAIDTAIAKVLDHGRFIMGPEIGELEKRLAAMAGKAHCVSCSSGTDSLLLVLMAWGVGPGDAVIVPAMTFASTAEVVALTGATPVFCDVFDDTFNMGRNRVVEMCEEIIRRGVKVGWNARVRANPFDREMLSLMKESGCNQLRCGVESLLPESLKNMKKK